MPHGLYMTISLPTVNDRGCSDLSPDCPGSRLKRVARAPLNYTDAFQRSFPHLASPPESATSLHAGVRMHTLNGTIIMIVGGSHGGIISAARRMHT